MENIIDGVNTYDFVVLNSEPARAPTLRKNSTSGSTEARASFIVSLRSAVKKNNPPRGESCYDATPVSRSEIKSLAQSIKALVHSIFKKKESLEWIQGHELDRVSSNMEKLLSNVRALKEKIGLAYEHSDSKVSEVGQKCMNFKIVLMKLSSEVAGLISGISSANDSLESREAHNLVVNCTNLVKVIDTAFENALSLVPSDALQTLGETRMLFGLAITRRMGLNGTAVPEEELDVQLHALFASFDADGSGDISLDELRDALSHMGVITTELVVSQLLASADTDGDGVVSFDEFRVLARAMLRANGIRILPRTLSAAICHPCSGCPTELCNCHLGEQQPLNLNPLDKPILTRRRPMPTPVLSVDDGDDRFQASPASPIRRPRWSSPERSIPFLGGAVRASKSPVRVPRRSGSPLGSPLRRARDLPASSEPGPLTPLTRRRARATVSPERVSRFGARPSGCRQESPVRAAGRGPHVSPVRRRSPVRSPVRALVPDSLGPPDSPIGRVRLGYSHLQTGARALQTWVPSCRRIVVEDL
jgi:hypothetical protein